MSNTGELITKYSIPAVTDVIVGKVAPQITDIIEYGNNAVGEGFQICLPDISKAIKIP